jgi:hypothetical protein
MIWTIFLALGINFGWGNHPTYSNHIFWKNYETIYCEDVTTTNECVHRDKYDFIYWYNGEIVDEHDDSIIPEDCTIESIEAGLCRFGILP